MSRKSKTNRTGINGKQIIRVPDQTGDFVALNSTTAPDLHIVALPGCPTPYTAEWYEWLKRRAAPPPAVALECPVHGTSVWIDCDGRATCPECGHFVQAVKAGTMQAKREKEARQESLFTVKEYL